MSIYKLMESREIPRAKFEFMRADGEGKPIKYFEIQLENVLISGVAPSLVAGRLLSEHVSLKYSKIKWTYTQQNIAGGIRGSTVGGWNSATNRIAA